MDLIKRFHYFHCHRERLNIMKRLKTLVLCSMLLQVLLCNIIMGSALKLEPWNEKIIRVACLADLAPYQFEEGEELKGIHVEIMQAVAEKCNLDLTWQRYSSLTECVRAIQSGEADVILGVSRDRSGLKDSGIIYSSEISSSYICMVARRDLEQELLSDTPYIGSAVYEYDSLPYSITLQYRNVRNFIGVGNQDRVFEELVSGTADIAFGVRTSLIYNLEKANLESEYPIIYNYVQPVQYCLAVNAKEEQLLQILNEGIAVVRASRQYDQILDRWTSELGYNPSLKDWLKEHIAVAVVSVSTVICIFAVILLMNYLLRVTVVKRTAELEQANERLRENAERSRYESDLLRQTIESNPNGILLFDESGTIELTNGNAERLLEGTGLVGRNVKEFWLMRKLLGDWRTGTVTETTVSERHEVEIGAEDRVYFFQYGICTFLKPGETKEKGRTYFILIEDITLKKIQDFKMLAFEKSQLMNQLVAGIAHEIRNPLASLKAIAQMAKDNVGDPDYMDAFGELVPNEIDRIDRLVTNLISYAKETQSSNSYEEVDVFALVNSCLTLMKALIEKNSIEIKVDIAPGLKLLVEEDHIRQVILNILLNSIDAIQQKRQSGGTVRSPHIYIRGRQNDNGRMIEIRDEGCGMSPQTVQRATRPFYSTKATGTGLGLAISSRYIAETGGLLTIHSVEGEYTSVQLSFPVKREDGRVKSV